MAGRQGGEVRQTILVLDNDLAVDQSGMALEFPAGLDHSAVLVRPVMTAATESADDVASVNT